MSEAKDFVIHEGVLIKYKGNKIGKDFALPEGIIGIGNNVFAYKEWDCDRLVIPESVETIGKKAFSAIYGSEVDEIIVRGNIKEIGASAFEGLRIKKIVFEGHVEKIGDWAFLYTHIDSFSVAGGIKAIGKKSFSDCKGPKMIDTPWIGKISKEAFEGSSDIDVDAVMALLNNKPTELPSAERKKPKAAKIKLSAEEEALCAPFRDIFDETALDKTYKKHKGTDEHIADVKLASGVAAPGYLIKCAIVPYAEQLVGRPNKISEYKTACYETRLNAMADRAEALLDKETLMSALKKLRSEGSSAWLLPYGRYANTEEIRQLLSDMKVWENWSAFGSVGRSDIIIARGALLLSDTKEAILHIDKVGQLAAYAQTRGTDADTIRDTVLSEFGFDENRKIRFDLGGNAVIVAIDQDLSLKLTDEATGKTVKSVPKKNADLELHKAVSASIKNLNKDIKNVVSNRKKALLAEYLSGASREVTDWKSLYLKNPVLNAVAQLVVWYQDGKTFTLTTDGAVDYNGDTYTLTDAPISVAHPIEVSDQLTAWQSYFVSRGLKQPFEQVWEPAYKEDDLKADRFKGYLLPVSRIINMEQHGIHSYGFKYYSDDYGFTLTDCELSYEDLGGYYFPERDNKLTLGEFSFDKLTRYVNHIVYLFDKWTVADRILADDVSVASCLHQFTLAQIMEFIQLAGENKCPNVTTILLDFKQKNFPEFDPFAEFTLE
jgi:hypothetical protein